MGDQLEFIPWTRRIFFAYSLRKILDMAAPFLGAEQQLVVGTETVIESDSADGAVGVVFEDDGQTGYFYARDHSVPDQLWVDALHIYNCQDMADSGQPCTVKIIWSQDYSAAALMINQAPKAVFHFGEQCGYAKDPFPKPDPSNGWTHSSDLSATRSFFFL